MRIAIVGSGISGLATAYYLTQSGHNISVFEQACEFGGHASGLDISYESTRGPVIVPVNPAFDIFNRVSYPRYIALLEKLNIRSEPCEFSYTYSRTTATGDAIDARLMLPALLKLRHFLQLFHVPEFLPLALASTRAGRAIAPFMRAPRDITFAEFLRDSGVAQKWIDAFFLPVFARPWGMTPHDMQQMPAEIVLRWADEHQVLTPRPVRWLKNSGGARHYVQSLVRHLRKHAVSLHASMPVDAITRRDDGVNLHMKTGATLPFDRVVIATNALHANRLLKDASPQERQLLGRFRYQRNHVVVHSDTRLLPAATRHWSYFNVNYNPATNDTYNCIWFGQSRRVPVFATNYRTLPFAPSDEKIWSHFTFHQPIYTRDVLDAQHALDLMQGNRHTWFCGIYCNGYGHHEDGLRSAERIAAQLRAQTPSTPAKNAHQKEVAHVADV